MSFFEFSKLNIFRNNPDVKNFLNVNMEGCSVINRNEFIDYMKYKEVDNAKQDDDRESNLNRKIYYYIHDLISKCKGSINKKYIIESLNNSINGPTPESHKVLEYKSLRGYKPDHYVKTSKMVKIKNRLKSYAPNYDFDILLLMSSRYKSLRQYSRQEKNHEIIGFLIVENGECDLHPNAYAMKLICLNNIVFHKTISHYKSTILLAAYLCMIKLHSCEQIGLLELAHGYKNMTGLCAYSKFGFQPDIGLHDPRCFSEEGNLQMSVDLSNIKFDDIIDILTNKVINKTHRLCNKVNLPTSVEETHEQKQLINKYQELHSLLYDIKRSPDPVSQDLKSFWNSGMKSLKVLQTKYFKDGIEESYIPFNVPRDKKKRSTNKVSRSVSKVDKSVSKVDKSVSKVDKSVSKVDKSMIIPVIPDLPVEIDEGVIDEIVPKVDRSLIKSNRTRRNFDKRPYRSM